MIFIATFKRYENETDDELIYRICSQKDTIGTWKDVCDILNELTNNDYNESAYRKKYQIFEKMLSANQTRFASIDSQLEEINIQKRELEKERKKLQTEKLEYNKWLREDARDELITEKIVEAITSLTPLEIPKRIERSHSNKEYLLVFGDEHYGVEFELEDIFGRIINSYSPEIFEDRMWELQDYVIEIIEDKGIDTLHIFSMGDFCDGVLRVSQLNKLKYGVVESTIKYANFISEWINMLSKFVNIKFYMTNGNHSELRMLGQPKGTFTEDNMGEIVAEFIKCRLSNNPNFTFISNPTGNIYAQIACFPILGIHGEVKDMEKALREYSSIYDVPISYLIAGHLHHSKKEEIGMNTEVINVPSIIGTDPYSLSLRKVSAPGAKLLEFDTVRGLTCEYNLKLIS